MTAFKKITTAAIDSSKDIEMWLNQFSHSQRPTARTLLTRLLFVSRDNYSSWLNNELNKLPANKTYALFAVTEQVAHAKSLWHLPEEGSSNLTISRPSTSQGSEDLVHSLISKQVNSRRREHPDFLFLDHPSLENLRSSKVHEYILIDDSIGSGNRVTSYINAMLSHPSFFSWWSYGKVKITVLSFARYSNAEKKIIREIRGSNHSKRKLPKSQKVDFISKYVFHSLGMGLRWGEKHQDIHNLCSQKKGVKKNLRFGYGNVLSNLVFYHSVPNNIPGLLWYDSSNWKSLMPGRSTPEWLINLLENAPQTPRFALSEQTLDLLKVIKRGVRKYTGIANRLNIDSNYARELVENAKTLGLVDYNTRLTAYGRDQLIQAISNKKTINWNNSLYIPKSWCAG